jgi:hypothetical protein
VNDLIKLGLVPKKSLVIKFPTEEQVPKSLHSHYILGYFDGNGTAGANTNISCGSRDFIYALKDVLPCEISSIYEKDKNIVSGQFHCYSLLIGRKKEMIKFYNWLYKDAELFLVRKKAKFEKYLKITNCEAIAD